MSLPSETTAQEPTTTGQTRLVIDAHPPGTLISPKLFGIFYEDLNHAGEGGVYAELVKNRSFNHPEALNGWSMVTGEDAEGTIGPAYVPEQNPVNPWALRLQIVDALLGRVGMANDGYWGIPVAEGREYHLTLDAWASEGFTGPLMVTLEGRTGHVFAKTAVTELTTEKQRITATLTAHGNNPQARLVIYATTPGTIWLDMVSLFPTDTWKNRPNGLRADLMEMAANLHPSFVRFPGGCFVEGDKLAEAFRWKESLGDIARRPGHWNRWGYFSTGGLGFHEYLQMCEDLGAEPLFVVNAGMSHTDTVPPDKLDAWIQDTLDALEYANGSMESDWGAKRAEAGHPEPFNLHMIEIGNENGGPIYTSNFRRFYQAVKGHYPEVQVVANMPVPGCPMDIVDEHYFEGLEKFAQLAYQYDSYDRKGPQIYVGEYACIQDAGLGNLRAALAEAAFMTGLERNGDVVAMASFAPLFVNMQDRHWEVDAIGFDTARCYGTPSYYVQQLFSHFRSTVVLPAIFEEAPKLPGEDGACALAAVAGRNKTGDEIIIKVVNLTELPQEVEIDLTGATHIEPNAREIVLTADTFAAENSLRTPRHVVPIATTITTAAPTFKHTFKGRSLTILRLHGC